MNHRTLLAVSLAASATYWAIGLSHASVPTVVLLKGLAVSALAVLAWPRSAMLAGGLAFSSLGDVLLEFRGMFAAGLASFFATHLIYIFLFRRFWRERPATGKWVAIAAIVLYSVAFLRILDGPPLGSLRIPVYFYVAAITLMVVSAIGATWTTRMVVSGALLFLISDSVLGFDRFVWHVPFRNLVVWPAYYIGQLALALGVLKEAGVRSSPPGHR